MTTPNIKSPAVPFGSLIVISGATGFIGSHVVDQALAAGYRVRGTTRDVEKAAWEVEHFEKKYGADKFELVAVPDMGVETAFDEAVKGKLGHFPFIAHILIVHPGRRVRFYSPRTRHGLGPRPKGSHSRHSQWCHQRSQSRRQSWNQAFRIHFKLSSDFPTDRQCGDDRHGTYLQ